MRMPAHVEAQNSSLSTCVHTDTNDYTECNTGEKSPVEIIIRPVPSRLTIAFCFLRTGKISSTYASVAPAIRAPPSVLYIASYEPVDTTC